MSSHTAGSRAIKIPLHGAASHSSNYSNPNRRRRSAAGRVAKPDPYSTPEASKTSSTSSDNWLPSHSTGQDRDHYQLRQTAIASPSDTGNSNVSTPPTDRQRKDKQRAQSYELGPPNAISPLFQDSYSPLGPSMLSSSSYKSINLNPHISEGDSDEPARLITYTKHSQGFTWNDELFLPSYMVGRHRYNGRRGGRKYRFGGDDGLDEDDGMADFDEEGEKCPVTDIFVTDEEAAAMMP